MTEYQLRSPLDKACDDQRDAFQKSISEAHKLGIKTGADRQLEQVMNWLDKNLLYYTDDSYLGDLIPMHRLEDDLKEAMRPTQENN